jgi:hypothetical protein
MPEAIADRMLALGRYFREGWASRITGDVEQVTGQSLSSFAQYARDIVVTGVLSEESEHGTRA